MAAKKKASKKKALATRKTGTALQSAAEIEEMMAKFASDDSARVASHGGGANMLSIKGGTFTLGDADLGDELTVVVIDFCNEKAWYDGKYDPENPGSPACWVVGKELPKDFVASHLSPVPQCDSCEDCEKNEWGSADTGRGKACSDKRRLMVVALEDLANEDLEDIEIAMLKVPPSSVTAFDKYIKGLEKVHKRPCFGVTTTITFDEEVDYPALLFSVDETVNDTEVVQKIIQLRESNEESLLQEYDPDNYIPPEEKKPAKRSKKKTSKKKGSKFSK